MHSIASEGRAVRASMPDYVDEPNQISRERAQVICEFFNTSLDQHQADFAQANDTGSHQITNADPFPGANLGKYRSADAYFFAAVYQDFLKGNV